MVAAGNQVVAQVAAHKAGAASDQHAVLLRTRLGLDGGPLVARQLRALRASRRTRQCCVPVAAGGARAAAASDDPRLLSADTCSVHRFSTLES